MKNVRVNREIEYNKNEKKINHQTTVIYEEEKEKKSSQIVFWKKKMENLTTLTT